MSKQHTKCLIIGSGSAGYTAAIYAARACLEPLVITGEQQGGQLTITNEVENYPGFAKPITGPWLMEQMAEQAKNCGAIIKTDAIERVDFTDTKLFKAYGKSGAEYTAETVIISTGAEAKWLGLKSEMEFQGRGVSGCAICDAFFYKNKNVLVVGGGNTAAEEALYLTNHARQVTLIHRRDQLRADKTLQKRVLSHAKINIMWNTVLDEVLGDNTGVTGAMLRNVQDDRLQQVAMDGIFIAIGHKPNTDIFKGLLTTDKEGYLVTAANGTATNIPGVFAAGDVQDAIYRQAVTAAGTGCMAALEAEKYLAAQAD